MSIIEKLGITPGPWKVINHESAIRIESNTIDIALLQKSENTDASIGSDANLISAAPEMLEALIEVINSAENGGEMYRGRDARNTAKLSIEKATGKTWEEIEELLKCITKKF